MPQFSKLRIRPRPFKFWTAAIAAALAALALPLAAGGCELPLRRVETDIPLPGKANRVDYAIIEPQRRLLSLAHPGSRMVTAIDLRTTRAVANVADAPSVYGALAVAELGEVFATATGQNRLAFVACDGDAKLLLVDMTDMHVQSVQEVGRDPDVLAFDPGLRRLYVPSERGVLRGIAPIS